MPLYSFPKCLLKAINSLNHRLSKRTHLCLTSVTLMYSEFLNNQYLIESLCSTKLSHFPVTANSGEGYQNQSSTGCMNHRSFSNTDPPHHIVYSMFILRYTTLSFLFIWAELKLRNETIKHNSSQIYTLFTFINYTIVKY